MGVNLYTQQQIGAAKSLRYAGDTPGKVDFTVDQTILHKGMICVRCFMRCPVWIRGASVFGVDITRSKLEYAAIHWSGG